MPRSEDKSVRDRNKQTSQLTDISKRIVNQKPLYNCCTKEKQKKSIGKLKGRITLTR